MEENYLPLFRKYRPQSFKDIVGQESLVKALSNAIELNKIANAYLFCGPRGTGKTSTARILAKSLNCESGPTLEPCQKCPSCVDITNATGLDVIEIDAASNRGIQDAKDLISQVQYAPINGKYKIFIIDEVHMLSTDAFNALLKTFEEPPKNVIFILATTEPHKVLETIISRCQRFDLRRITTEDIVKRLREISDLENIKITDEALLTIAKNVSGGLRDSLALLDQVSILGVKEEITKENIEELLGKINFDTLLNLLNKIYKQDIEDTLISINEIYSKGNEPKNLAENFIEFLRNVVLVLHSKGTKSIKNYTTLIDDNIEKINNSNFDKEKVAKILSILIEYYKEIKTSTNPYLWMELAGIASCRLDLNVETQVNTVSLNSEIKKVEKIQIIKDVNPIAKPIIQEQAKPAVVEETTKVENVKKIENTIVPEEIAQKQDSVQIWANILQAITSIPTRALYSGVAKLVSIKDNKIILGFLNDDTLNKAKSESKINVLNAAIESTYPNLSCEFIKIDHDTKVLNIKPQMASQKPSNIAPKTNVEIVNEKKVEKEKQEDEFQQEKNEEKHYSQKVKDMVEQYGGRIIE